MHARAHVASTLILSHLGARLTLSLSLHHWESQAYFQASEILYLFVVSPHTFILSIEVFDVL